jgi:ribosome-binding factor A
VAGNRPDRVGEAIRDELSQLIARDVHDPGIGFLTLTRVSVTPDLQQARVYYTALGDARAQAETARALTRATPFLRRQIGARIRLRRVPELTFFYDKSIAQQDRIEQILQELKAEAAARPAPESDDRDPQD